ncbi:hypothetical protein GCM10007094_25700 [Pseudovibrio japonicus]|uniref:Uncharacterized protein n=1 Tax=Pseudovibrio japonicus TaxID=366534 RepID=A0ABQ3EEA5_9HYPH|nr:hypothetical protein [Pseudovibrio japonicus]GHB35076.1 hypothetical protein GCM10007094_25700 [Pseudovibrio japonicus]
MLEVLVGLVALLLLLILKELRGIHSVVGNAITYGPGNAIYQINSGIADLAGTEHLDTEPDPTGSVRQLSEQMQKTNDLLTNIESQMSPAPYHSRIDTDSY